MMQGLPTLGTGRTQAHGRDGTVLATLALCGLTALAAAGAASAPASLRLLFFVAISTALSALCFVLPRAAVLTTLVYLVVMALIRRLLIPVSPWSSFDPLLMVGPLIAVVLLIKLFLLEKRPPCPDLLSKFVLGVLVLTVLQVANPGAGGIAGGIAGLFFIGAPLLWFFIGRELSTDEFVGQVLTVVLFAGLLAGAYGLWQLTVGFPSWDTAWLAVAKDNGLDSLDVGGVIRAFGSFASFLEYALVLASALVVGVAMLMQGRTMVLLALPPLALMLFLASSRGPLITAILGIVVMAAIRSRRPRRAAAVILVGVAAAAGSFSLLGSISAASPLVAHQTEGLSDPLNPESSTLLIHISLVVDGVVHSFSRPLGSGTGSTNQAGAKLGAGGGETAPTEIDVSNQFVALGLPGGILYALVVLTAFIQALRMYFRGHDHLLPVIGLLVVGLGQWLSGGHWFLAPVTWLCIGFVAAATLRAPTRPFVKPRRA